MDALPLAPRRKNGPLYWYSHLPPQFGDVDVDDDFDGVRCSAHVTRGPMSSALYNVKDDSQQEHNLYRVCNIEHLFSVPHARQKIVL